MIHNLSKTNSIFNVFLSEIRDAKIQKDAMRFRKNMERISEIMAYELSKTLDLPGGMPLAKSLPHRSTPGCPPKSIPALPAASGYGTMGHTNWEAIDTPPPTVARHWFLS